MTEPQRAMRRIVWSAWFVLTLGLISWLAYAMLERPDKTVFMPGPLSPGHHQLQMACGACHTKALGGGEVLQKACVECHGEDRRKPFDSHPRAKFTDPRNADRLEKIDALHCTTCHVEHRPAATRRNGVTQPVDVCFYCHRDIAKDRPSHAGMEFSSCTASGCHNFHDNRALYTDFLVKHLHEPEQLKNPRLPAREFAAVLDEVPDYPRERYPVQPLDAAHADAPAGVATSTAVLGDWADTAHARAGVNCSACHVPADPAGGKAQWSDSPGQAGCASCHALELQRFKRGKHGMRLAAGLPPMTAGEALMPMREQAADKELGCNACHTPHRYDVRRAAVEACLECHNDTHSLAYRDSPHYVLWQKELRGELPEGSGVSCAGCHMPRVNHDVNDWFSRVMVDHNQSADLSPNSKMIRPACLHCHGLEFSLDALADRDLIERNFAGKPAVHVASMEMAEDDARRAEQEATEQDTDVLEEIPQ